MSLSLPAYSYGEGVLAVMPSALSDVDYQGFLAKPAGFLLLTA